MTSTSIDEAQFFYKPQHSATKPSLFNFAGHSVAMLYSMAKLLRLGCEMCDDLGLRARRNRVSYREPI